MTGFTPSVSVSAAYSPGGGEWFPYGCRITLRDCIRMIADMDLEEVHQDGMILATGDSDSNEEEWVVWTFWLPEGMRADAVRRFARKIGWCKATFSRD